jgi:hypothetical protein
VSLKRHVGAAEQEPAFGIVWAALQLLRELRHDLYQRAGLLLALDGSGRLLRAAFGQWSVRTAGCTQRQIQKRRRGRQDECDGRGARGDARLARRCDIRRVVRVECRRSGEHAPLDFGAGCFRLVATEQAPPGIPIDLRELVAIDAQIELRACACRASPPTDERQQQEAERDDRHQGRRDDERGHSLRSSSTRASRSSSALLKGAAAFAPW